MPTMAPMRASEMANAASIGRVTETSPRSCSSCGRNWLSILHSGRPIHHRDSRKAIEVGTPAAPQTAPRIASATRLRRLSTFRISPGNGNDLAPPRPNVDLPRPRDLLLRVLDHLPPLRQPPRRAGDGEQHREHLHREAHPLIDYSRVEGE